VYINDEHSVASQMRVLSATMTMREQPKFIIHIDSIMVMEIIYTETMFSFPKAEAKCAASVCSKSTWSFLSRYT